MALDPADSWLVYARSSGAGSKVLSVNATWKVPAYPTTRGGGNAPGFWFGVEPNPADVLIQPILAYGASPLWPLARKSLPCAVDASRPRQPLGVGAAEDVRRPYNGLCSCM